MIRRTFLFLTAAGAAAIVAPIVGCRYYDEPLTHILTQPDFLGRICDQKTIADIGSAYLAAFPGEAHRTDLIRPLLKGSSGAHDYARLPKHIDDNIRDDFATGNTVTIRGWILARTEARQCAIYSLIQQ
jgi:hypothetical protein